MQYLRQINFNKRSIDKSDIVNIMNAMRHRDYDDYGLYVSNHVGLEHRILSIIDLSTGHSIKLNVCFNPLN